MDLFTKGLYTERTIDKTPALEVFRPPVIARLLKIIGKYSSLRYRVNYVTYKNLEITGRFLEKLYFHLKGETPQEENVSRGLSEYSYFIETTTLDKFFDSLELFCLELSYHVEKINTMNDYNNLSEFADFIKNTNELFIHNGVPYQLRFSEKDSRYLVVKISDSSFIKEAIQDFVRLIKDSNFLDCENKFIEAENCFAKQDYDGVMIKCNALIETILLKILNKGSGTIEELIEDYLKKFSLPREFNKSLKAFPGTIQHIRSTKPQDVHGKNSERNEGSFEIIKKELAEYVLSETASIGRFIMKTYQITEKGKQIKEKTSSDIDTKVI